MKTTKIMATFFVFALVYAFYAEPARAAHSLDAADGSPTDAVYVDNDGNVGIRTTDPTQRLDVNGNIQAVRFLDRNDPNYFVNPTGTPRSAVFKGNVGIGTTSPASKLHISGGTGSVNVLIEADNNNSGEGDQPSITLSQDGGLVTGKLGYFNTLNRLSLYNTYNDLLTLGTNNKKDMVVIDGGGNVGIGATSPSEKLTVRGNILLEDSNGATVMELGEGLDYAEGFDVSGEKKVNPGTVLTIDSANPGKLAISNKAYDRKVAGIVAGAKGQGSGVRLGVGQFDCDVALAGRVYCNVDATEVEIEPGDLLTTSAMPGYAAKAVDYTRAQGAILGKAMERLEKGKTGQILVLVTLQ